MVKPTKGPVIRNYFKFDYQRETLYKVPHLFEEKNQQPQKNNHFYPRIIDHYVLNSHYL